MTIRGTTSVCHRFRRPQRGADTPLRGNGRTRQTRLTGDTAFASAAPGCIRLRRGTLFQRPRALCGSLRTAYWFPSMPLSTIIAGFFTFVKEKKKLTRLFEELLFSVRCKNGFSTWQRTLFALCRKDFSIHCSARVSANLLGSVPVPPTSQSCAKGTGMRKNHFGPVSAPVYITKLCRRHRHAQKSFLAWSLPRPRHKTALRERVFASSSRAFSRARGVIGSPFMMRASSATLPCSSSGLISVKVLPPEISFSISR